ncbi:MAG TPA: beta-ketoacyl-ACP synthase II [Clostridiales bacterium]|nr:beta-ketoacyl-ACP synthase II [Clostridiales bacterium]
MDKRVVITGLGAITPIGKNVNEFFDSIKESKCGVDFIKAFDISDFPVKLAAEIKDYNARDFLDIKESKRMEKFCQFAIIAANEAVDDSKLDINNIDNERFGVIIGSGIGGIGKIETETQVIKDRGPRRVNPLFIPLVISNMAAGNVAIKFNAKGICTNVVTACATGSHTIGEAFRNIKHGYADIILAGGAESTITPLSVAGFSSLTALSKSTDPLRASIPFDKDRNGFVMGEGAGVVVVEEYEHAKARGANIYAEIVGYGATCDAFHMTAPAPGGEGAARAIKLAINEAGITYKDISYINAHGTSTELNDKLETDAIKKVFGEDAYNVAISSTKSMTGHLLGAAGAVEAIVCVKAIEESYIPATVGYKNKDEECDLDYVPEVGRNKKLNYVMSNSLGFGGHNASLIFKSMED